ncbi:MAG: UDP-N-acetylglucosamine 2-epimerase (non-hydrolyzing) [Verrucomicrobiae bacterium]|nr:UDP-N-acetylglucosamine 2-epimerase (non-hydrolyzing) [Verrucomicrobiae bacterium]
MPLLDLIAGARPNFIKVAPIIHAFHRRFGDPRIHGNRSVPLRYRLIHTGQHYDRAMSEAFFEQLDIPEPHINLAAGGGSQAEQTGTIMTRYEELLALEPSELCLVVGDVTSTLACAIVARKARIPVAHVEGGIRSGDWSMPEEINRIVTDSISNWFFTTSETANANLRRTGVTDDRIFFVGNTMIDTLLANLTRLRPPSIWTTAGLSKGGYFVLTLHRPANVDNSATLGAVLDVIRRGTRMFPIIFPVHPRTRKVLETLYSRTDALTLIEPLGYLEFNYLVKHARAVITDSGGITEEATVLGVPCLTLRENTERPETVTHGTSELIGADPAKLMPALDRLFADQWKRGVIPEKWDGHSSDRIVATLEKLLLT